jgi:hypothetical protein
LKNCIKLFLVLLVILFTLQCGEKKETPGKTGVNSPPKIDQVVLQPSNPTVQSEITARIISSDKEGDPITYKIKWFLNGTEIGEGMSFSYEEVNKGDKIAAEVTPSDGKASGKPVKSDEVTIAGTPPRILSVQIAPESLFVTTPQAVVTATVEDLDRDSINLIIHWLVKDEVIPDTSNVLQLQKYNLKKNDVVTATAFADDGEFRSEPFPFELVIINAPPVFSTKVDSVKSSPDSIYYPLPIFDPDGDALTFEILESPEGVTIDQQNGIVQGSAGDVNEFEIQVRATDTDGAYLDAHFTITSPFVKE